MRRTEVLQGLRRMKFEDIYGVDLRAVLRTFSEITGLNIVIDPTIQGTVDVALRDVPWDQALDIILRANKLGYVVDGTIVRAEIVRASLVAVAFPEGSLGPVSRYLGLLADVVGDHESAVGRLEEALSRSKAIIARTDSLPTARGTDSVSHRAFPQAVPASPPRPPSRARKRAAPRSRSAGSEGPRSWSRS